MRVPLNRGYILHTRPYRETSLLVELFSRDHGRATVVARGARREKNRNRPLHQPLQPLLLAWTARGELGTLSAIESDGAVLRFPQLGLLAAFYLNELIMRLLHRHDAHVELYDAYDNALRTLCTTQQPDATLRVFEKRLLESVGYGLILTHLPAGGAPIEAATSYRYVPGRGPEQGDGIADGAPVVSGRTLLALAGEQFDDADTLREAKSLMRCLLAPHLGAKPLSSRELFRSFLDLNPAP
jgi:DNA repair protein RecO (recombination protein O)